jgi:hypothetical protein
MPPSQHYGEPARTLPQEENVVTRIMPRSAACAD